ncbi:MAG: hypothetical protein ABIL09_01880 [Gemmatimonadota bacterium]
MSSQADRPEGESGEGGLPGAGCEGSPAAGVGTEGLGPAERSAGAACCANHPDRPTSYVCQKHGVSLCEECLCCRDPQLYCRHRTACPIHYLEKENRSAAKRGGAAVGPG